MKYLFSLLILVFLISTSKGQINNRMIISLSQRFIKQIDDNYDINKDCINAIVEKDDTLAYVVQLKPKGFLVLTPTEKLPPVLAFSLKANFIFKDSPRNTLLNLIKNDMRHQLELIKDDKSFELNNYFNSNSKKWLESQKEKNISNRWDIIYGPYLPDIWGQVNCKDQDSSYIYVTNYYTPNHYAPGCVALSLTQILHYYRWPHRGQGSHTDYDNSGSSQGTYSADFDTAYYDYPDMLNEYMYKVSDDLERRAVGLLAYHTGIALDMDYENDGSTSNVNKTPGVVDSYFRGTGHYETNSWSSFWDRFDENIEDGHPLQLNLGGTGNIGHAPVCDGYRNNNGDPLSERYYHLNMGWWGSSNAWYRLRGSFNAGGYTSVDGAVFDLLPDPQFHDMDVQNSNIFTLEWEIADNLQCDSFELQKKISGSWNTIAIINEQYYTDTVTECGNYQYRVRAKMDGHWYFNSYSEPLNVFVEGDITSLYFDGDDSYFVNDKNNHLDVNGSDWTIETWVYPTEIPASGTYPAIISRKYSFELYFRNVSGGLGVGIVALNGSGSGFTIEGTLTSGSNTMTLNKWHHIAVSKSGGTTRLFIDGIQVGSSTDSDFDLDASISAVNFGARYDSNNGGYIRYIQNCKLDEIRYSKVSRYSSNFSPKKYDYFIPDSDDIFIFHLDEGSDLDITDATGYFTGIKLRKSPHTPEWSCDAEYNGYYVDQVNGDDNNPGTQSQPWKTINKVNNTAFEPGDHIHFKRGNIWNEYLYLENKQGTDYAHIVFESYDTGDNPVINYQDYDIIANGSSYLKFKDFDIKGDLGIMIKDDSGTNPPTGIIIENNIIHDENQNGNTNAGIYISHGANNISVLNNEIYNHHIGVWIGEDNNIQPGCNNLISGNSIHDNTQNGIGISSSDCSSGNETVLSSNQIYNNGFHGIELSGRYYIIEKNELYYNGQNAQGGASGIHLYSRAEDEDETYDSGGDHNVINDNIVYNTIDNTGARTDGNGIQMDMWCDSNLVYNNIVYDNDGAGIILYGASGNKVFNNTSYGNGQDLGNRFGQFEITVLAAQLSGANGNGFLHSANNRIKNNIGMATGNESTRYAVSICDTSILDNNIFENNLWFNDSGNNNTGIIDLINHTVTEKTIQEWNSYSWTADEISSDPLFVDISNKDFHLDHSSPAIDAGQDLTQQGVNNDRQDKKRPLLYNFDAGAYEHGIYWIGEYSSGWNRKLNWFGETVPDSTSCVTIFAGNNNPVILENTTIKKLYLSQGAQIKIMQNHELNIEP